MSTTIESSDLDNVKSRYTNQNPTLYNLYDLPDPGYENHPAYGKCFPAPSFGDRFNAIKRLLPWMGIVMFKRAFMMDRIPALPGYSGHIKGGFLGRLKVFPQYVPYIVRGIGQSFVSFFTGNRVVVPPQFKEFTDNFVKVGIGASRMDEAEFSHVLALVEQPLDELRIKRNQMTTKTFIDNTRFFNTGDDKELFDTLNDYLEKYGMLAAASSYIGRPARLTHLLIQINDPDDKYLHGKFPDIGLPDPKTNYMHVDTSYDMVKCVVYLNEVTHENGPFSYCTGTHKIRPVGLNGVIRRAMDRSGMSDFKRESRKDFWSLPKYFRRKCTFGADILDGTIESDALINSEYFFTSEEGNMGLFANNGVHRGGLTKSGERRVLFGIIA